MKELQYSWNLTFPGIWRTREGYYLTTIDNRVAKRGYGWYKFQGHEFMAKGSFQAQLKAEEIIGETAVFYVKEISYI